MAARSSIRHCRHLPRLQVIHIRTFSASTTRQQAEPAEQNPFDSVQRAQRPQRFSTRESSLKKTARTKEQKRSHVPVKSSVRLEIDGQHYSFSPRLLRDLCSCPLCIDQSTRQKLLCSADIPADVQVTESFLENDNYRLRWSIDAPGYGEDHLSSISLQALRRLTQTGVTDLPAPALPARHFWDAAAFEQHTEDFDFDTYMNDDKSLLKALRQLHTHGLLMIRSVPDDETSVEKLAERIGPLKTTFYGRTWDVRSVPDAKNVAYTAQNLGFHMDLMYMHQPPHLQLLHCIRSSSAGGASLFTDSFKAVNDLAQADIRDFNTLSSMLVDYHYDHAESQYYHQRRPVIEQQKRHVGNRKVVNYSHAQDVRKDEEASTKWSQDVRAKIESFRPMDFVDSVAWSPPFQAPPRLADFEAPSPDKKSASNLLSSKYDYWHAAAQKFNRLIHRPEGIYERLMKPGECVIFDNRRVLHARKAFEVGDAGKERWLRGAYIDKDPYLSKLHVMGRQEMEAQQSTGSM